MKLRKGSERECFSNFHVVTDFIKGASENPVLRTGMNDASAKGGK
jgi:hypothetical protein